MEVLIISVTIILLAAIIAKVVLNHRDYRVEEFQYTMDRFTTNEDAADDHSYEWVERQGEIIRRHTVTPKMVQTNISKHFRNF